MGKQRDRFSISALGEWYRDLLAIDAWINARTDSAQANSLLCAKLQERESRIKERVEYLAKKRGVDPEILWQQIIKGTAKEVSGDEGWIEDLSNEQN